MPAAETKAEPAAHSAYTPGPWRRQGFAVLCDGWRSYHAKRTVCSVRPYPRTKQAHAEGFANADLIAAAPDLLAAGVALLKCPSVAPYLRTEPYKALAAAIAKAEGC